MKNEMKGWKLDRHLQKNKGGKGREEKGKKEEKEWRA